MFDFNFLIFQGIIVEFQVYIAHSTFAARVNLRVFSFTLRPLRLRHQDNLISNRSGAFSYTKLDLYAMIVNVPKYGQPSFLQPLVMDMKNEIFRRDAGQFYF